MRSARCVRLRSFPRHCKRLVRFLAFLQFAFAALSGQADAQQTGRAGKGARVAKDLQVSLHV